MLRVLFYHRVNPFPRDRLSLISREITVRPEAFRAQLACLKARGFQTLSSGEIDAVVRGEREPDGRDIVITFDDGYEDVLLWACPVLEEFGFSAIVFVISGFVGGDSHDHFTEADSPGHGRFLTWEQLRDMHRRGITIGSHSCTHPLLTRVGRAAVRRELVESKAAIVRELNTEVDWFAYPVGDFNAEVEQEVTNAGYKAAFTTITGVNEPGTSPTKLRRTEVSASDSMFTFKMKMAGNLDWVRFKDSAAFRALITWPNRFLLR